MFSGVYTNFSSFVALEHKFGIMYTLLHRSFTIVSDFSKFHFEFEILKKTLHKNGSPTKFVDKCIANLLLIYLFKNLFLPPFQNWNLE